VSLSPKARRALVDRYRIIDGADFRLADRDPADKGILSDFDKDEGAEQLARGVAHLAALQERLYADGRFALLVVFQAMDAAGKDGTIKHVMSGVNPAGVSVTSFKQPGPVELAHDFLWRIHMALPANGRIGIFNRSHYEDVLVSRVHPEIIADQGLPHGPTLDGRPASEKFWDRRLKDIAHFERYLTHQNIHVIKFFLHVSKEEQRKRLLARLDDEEKLWKFSPSDVKERDYWDQYQHAYEAAIAATAHKRAPWFVVPADRKWYARIVVVEALIDLLESLDPQPPESGHDAQTLAKAREALQQED
jgi:PPK2 family polyphosphate:nucleotide phosphotransferase